MKKIAYIFMLIIAIFSWHTASSAPPDKYDIQVEANPRKVNGSPWDGSNVQAILGPLMGGVENPPDLMICLFSETGLSDCLTKRGNNHESRCHDSNDCEWREVNLPQGILGIVIIDLDLKYDDFVDAVILLENSNQQQSVTADKIESAMRDFIKIKTPASTASEAERREREFQRISLTVCMDAPCALRQSRISLLPSQP
jgi:hypothetical protein